MSREPAANSPQASAQLDGIEASQVVTVDVRLPVKANNMGRNAAGRVVGSTWLTAVVNSRQTVEEATFDNNSATLNRIDIPMAE